MICLWCKYVDVITYDGISWGEACDSCIQIYDMHEHAVRYFLRLTMMNVLMMTCKTWHVDYFLWYYDGIANALVACWGVMIHRTPQVGREGRFIWWSCASPYARGRISNTIWAGDKLNQHYICQWFLCLVYSSWWIALEELWDHLDEAKCLMF